MKSALKFFVGLSLILSLGLAGCNDKTQSTTTEPEIVEPSEPSDPEEPPVDPEVKSHTAEEIAGVFNEGIGMYGLAAEFYDIEGVFTGYYLGVNFGESADDSEENLSGAVYTLASFLPDFLAVYDEEYCPADEENDAEYDLFLVTEDFSAAVELYGYLDDGLLISEIYIYDIAE